MPRKDSKEWNGGRAEYRVRRREQNRNTGYNRFEVEWGGWCVSSLFAIVTMIGLYCPNRSGLITKPFMAREELRWLAALSRTVGLGGRRRGGTE